MLEVLRWLLSMSMGRVGTLSMRWATMTLLRMTSSWARGSPAVLLVVLLQLHGVLRVVLGLLLHPCMVLLLVVSIACWVHGRLGWSTTTTTIVTRGPSSIVTLALVTSL